MKRREEKRSDMARKRSSKDESSMESVDNAAGCEPRLLPDEPEIAAEPIYASINKNRTLDKGYRYAFYAFEKAHEITFAG